MSEFLEAKSLTPEEQERLAEEVEKRIAEKLKDGTLTERDVREIEELRLRPLPDIQDVQNVYENHLFKPEQE
jgi:CO dehydrogenase/acetyl-CoA synthase beta subunit